MIMQCPVCKKIRKFGKWVRLPEEARDWPTETFKEVYCPDHEGKE